MNPERQHFVPQRQRPGRRFAARHKLLIGLPILAWLLSGALWAAPIRFASPEGQTCLVELFTSEGCSSCPPSERWLSSLKDAPGLWTNFVPVAFHVDYWDNASWRDPYARRQFSDRQRTYAQAWGGRPVYTPGPVLDGTEWTRLPPDRAGPAKSGAAVGVLIVESEDCSRWRVRFTPVRADGSKLEIQAAALICDVTVGVKGGENRARQLKHDFVALNLVKQPTVARGQAFEGTFALSFPAQTATNRLALAVWVTPVGKYKPLQATGGWLTGMQVVKP